MAYMAFCGDSCTSLASTSSLKWFKIAEEGLRPGFTVGDDNGWLQNDFWENQNEVYWNVTVPAGLRKGAYMVRHEIVNLEQSPVQFYPNCAALEVGGEGEEVPGEEFLVEFPGAYAFSGELPG